MRKYFKKLNIRDEYEAVNAKFNYKIIENFNKFFKYKNRTQKYWLSSEELRSQREKVSALYKRPTRSSISTYMYCLKNDRLLYKRQVQLDR